MKFEFDHNDKIIRLNIEGNIYIVDTGSPESISLNNNINSVKINDKLYKLPYIEDYALKINPTLDKLIPNIKIDGLIGMDIIKETNLTIDYINYEITFGLNDVNYDVSTYTIPIKLKNNLVFADFYIPNNKLEMILDTGSSMTYVKDKYIDRNTKGEAFIDYSPTFGEISGYLYSFYEYYHKENINVGILPYQLNFLCDGIISVYDFCMPGFIKFDFKKNQAIYSERIL